MYFVGFALLLSRAHARACVRACVCVCVCVCGCMFVCAGVTAKQANTDFPVKSQHTPAHSFKMKMEF